MPRPPKPRWVEFEPEVTWFVPSTRPAGAVDPVVLTVDELEALRLKDVEGLEQEECAQRMNLAQSSFQRLLAAARQKVAGALVAGKAIQVSGGHYVVVAPRFRCGRCGHGWRRGGPAGTAERELCPACGSTQVYGVPGAEGEPEAAGGRGCGGRGRGRGRGRGQGLGAGPCHGPDGGHGPGSGRGPGPGRGRGHGLGHGRGRSISQGQGPDDLPDEGQ